MKKYGDMLDLPRPPSRRPKMQRQDRAKLFAPFAALNGHSQAIHDREQILEPRMELTAFSQEKLNQTLQGLQKGDVVTAIWFVPLKQTDEGALGQYRTAAGTFQKLDMYGQVLYLEQEMISLENLIELRKQKTVSPF